ncbi:DUF2255 family protein [Rathayibacter sp. YIM 133350]|uniref:DUF2255 family protein n=1 Tax=Rathayibacter sp. YIM 133350 TaxID=3131992 RepID=UPI00307F654D
MADWTPEELQKIGAAEEIGIASRRADGSLRPYVTIWAVRAGDELYVRSAYGSDNPWYRRALASGRGSIRAAGVERDVEFADAEDAAQDDIDAAYHAKYDRHGPRIVGTVVGEKSHGVTLRLVPVDAS